jgi:hypothetical protein
MPKLTLTVRIAAGSILFLSLIHILFWGLVAFGSVFIGLAIGQFALLFLTLCAISIGGVGGIVVAVGIFRTKNWARIAALALGAIVACVCAFAVLVLCVLIFGLINPGVSNNPVEDNRANFIKMAWVYIFIFSVATWWIFLFSRKSVASQFPAPAVPSMTQSLKGSACPPPITLLAWLMIVTSALSAISWPLLLGRIPAMLFTHVFSAQTSKWIWTLNILLFLICGVGLLKLQRWSYTGTIALHAFWLVSLFITQLSANYPRYLGACLAALQADETTVYFIHFGSSPWVAAISSAIPTALLIAGLFYYRRAFLKTVQDSHHPPS